MIKEQVYLKLSIIRKAETGVQHINFSTKEISMKHKNLNLEHIIQAGKSGLERIN